MAVKKVGAKKNFEETVAQVEAEDMEKINLDTPMTDEDGIVHDVPLLCGYRDPETGELHTTFSYREMDGRDEEAISKGDVRSNGAKLTNVLCERCVVQIGSLTKKECGPKKWGHIIRSMLSGDLDYMMLKIREISKGKTITFTHKCRNCNTKLKTEIGTDELGIIPFGGLEEIPFTLPGRGYKDNNGKYHKEGVLRLMNGYDREVITPLLMKNKAQATTSLIVRTVTFNDDTPVFQDNVKAMSLKDREYLENLSSESVFGVTMELTDIICPTCGYDMSEDGAQSDFL